MARICRLEDAPLTPLGRSALRPEWFVGKVERRLAKPLGLTQFGVNHLTLAPGATTALRHWHEAEDEFVYVLAGEASVIDNDGAHVLPAGSYVAFPAGEANGHHVRNLSDSPVELLVIGSRRPGEETIHYPDDPVGPINK
jgi:uncharacterized cupin superfamily protein